MTILRASGLLIVLAAAWQGVVTLAGVPPYILPGPVAVGRALGDHGGLLARHAGVTGLELLLGLGVGVAGGLAAAIGMLASAALRRVLLPVLVASQAVPVFALAPLLVLWLGYGLAPKVAMAALIIFFPVASSGFDGLRRTDPGWLDLASVMNATPLRGLWLIRVPAALPSIGSGLRVAAATAPIGVVIGEWVGASRGLGALMLHANARLQTDLMFAALIVLAALAIALYFAADRVARRLTRWSPS